MKRYANSTLKEFKKTLSGDIRERWLISKGMVNTEASSREYRGAVATCHRKIRYSWLSAVIDAIRLGNNVYKCHICRHYHTSRQTKTINRILHSQKGLLK